VLFRFKDGVTEQQVDSLIAAARSMKDAKIPGLVHLEAGRGLVQTAHKAKGYHVGLFASFETFEYLQVRRVLPE
jgi:hypothetical protein